MSESTVIEQPATLTDELSAAYENYETEEPTDDPAEDIEIEEAEETEGSVDEAVEPADEVEETAETEELAVMQPPEHWPAEDKEMFAAQTPEAQQFLLNRHKAMEGDYTRKMQEMAPLREYEPVKQMFAPYEDQLRQSGSSPAQIIQRWAQVDQQLTQDPASTIAWLAQQYGVNLDGEAPQVNPEVMTLKQELSELRNSISQREQAEYSAKQSAAMNDVTAFYEEKTEAGELAHPYIDEVMGDMIALAKTEVAEGKQPKLSDLYDRAVWMNTSVREKHLASQRQAEEAKRQAEARQKAAKAKRAAKTVTGSPSGSSPDPDLSLQDQLKQAWN